MSKVISEINGSGLFAQSAYSASTAINDELGLSITATYATKSELPSTAGLMESSKLEVVNNKITGYDGTAFAGGGGGNTYTTTDTNYLTIDNDESTINFTDKTKQAIDNVPTGTNYDLVGGNNIKFTVDDTEHQIVIDVEAPLSTYQIFDYATTNAQQTIDCWKEGKIPVLRIAGYSALLWPCRISALDPTTLTTAGYQYFGCNYNASSFTAYLQGASTRSSGLFTACNVSTYNTFTANANKWLSAVSAQSANWNTVSSLSANKEDKITYGYNDNKIVSINGSALSAGSNYEGISPIIVDNENKTVGAETREVVMQSFTHDDSLVHTETDEEYAIGVNTNVVALKSEIPSLNGYLQGSDLAKTQAGYVSSISGVEMRATRADKDDQGNTITATYPSKTTLSAYIEGTSSTTGWGESALFGGTWNLKSIRGAGTTTTPYAAGPYFAGLGFGCSDTRGAITLGYNSGNPMATFAAGDRSKPNWWWKISGTSGNTYELDSFATKSEVSSRPGTLLGECFVSLGVPTGSAFATTTVLSASGFSSTPGFISAMNGENLYFHSDIKNITGVNVEFTYGGGYGFTVGSAGGHYWSNMGGEVLNAEPANGKTFSRVGYIYNGAQSGNISNSVYDGSTRHFICTGTLGNYCNANITHRISNLNSARNKWSELSADWLNPYVCIKCYKA